MGFPCARVPIRIRTQMHGNGAKFQTNHAQTCVKGVEQSLQKNAKWRTLHRSFHSPVASPLERSRHAQPRASQPPQCRDRTDAYANGGGGCSVTGVPPDASRSQARERQLARGFCVFIPTAMSKRPREQASILSFFGGKAAAPVSSTPSSTTKAADGSAKPSATADITPAADRAADRESSPTLLELAAEKHKARADASDVDAVKSVKLTKSATPGAKKRVVGDDDDDDAVVGDGLNPVPAQLSSDPVTTVTGGAALAVPTPVVATTDAVPAPSSQSCDSGAGTASTATAAAESVDAAIPASAVAVAAATPQTAAGARYGCLQRQEPVSAVVALFLPR